MTTPMPVWWKSRRKALFFEVYLTSAGSYENATESERDILTTDADGFAASRICPMAAIPSTRPLARTIKPLYRISRYLSVRTEKTTPIS